MFPLNRYGRALLVLAAVGFGSGTVHAARYNVVYGANGVNTYTLITPTNPAASPVYETHTPVTSIPNNPNYNGFTYQANGTGGLTGATETRIPVGANGTATAPITLLEQIAKPALIAAVGRILGGPYGTAAVMALPHVVEWFHNAGIEKSVDGTYFIDPSSSAVCTVAPCYTYNVPGIVDSAASASIACSLVALKYLADGYPSPVSGTMFGDTNICVVKYGPLIGGGSFNVAIAVSSVPAAPPGTDLGVGRATDAQILAKLEKPVNIPPAVAVDLQTAGQTLPSDAGLTSGPATVPGTTTSTVTPSQTTSSTTTSTVPNGANSTGQPVSTTNTTSSTNYSNNTVTQTTTNTTSEPNNGPVTTNITTTTTTANVTNYVTNNSHISYGNGTTTATNQATQTQTIAPNPKDPDTVPITSVPSVKNTNTTPENTNTTPVPTTAECTSYPDRIGCASFGTPPIADSLSKLTIPVSVTALVFAHASCPAPVTFTAFARSYEFSYDPFCVQLERIRVLLMALASLGAAYILADSFRIS